MDEFVSDAELRARRDNLVAKRAPYVHDSDDPAEQREIEQWRAYFRTAIAAVDKQIARRLLASRMKVAIVGLLFTAWIVGMVIAGISNNWEAVAGIFYGGGGAGLVIGLLIWFVTRPPRRYR